MVTTGTSLQAAIAILCNMLLSVSLVIINKQIVSVYKFHFMTMLTGIHFYSSFIGCFILFALGYMRYKPVSSYLSIFRISLASLLSIIFMNYNLAYNSVGFYQMSKLFFIPATLLIEFVSGLNNQSFSLLLILSLCLIVGGMMLVVDGEISITWQGLVWMSLGVVATSIAQVQFAPLKKALDLDAIQLLFHTAPWLTVGTFISVPLFDSTDELLEFSLKPIVILHIVGSGLVAVAFNISNYTLLSLVSPTTYNVIGHSKTMLIITIGSYIFNTVPSTKTALGMTITCSGALLYSMEMRHQKERSERAGVEEALKTTETRPLLPLETAATTKIEPSNRASSKRNVLDARKVDGEYVEIGSEQETVSLMATTTTTASMSSSDNDKYARKGELVVNPIRHARDFRF